MIAGSKGTLDALLQEAYDRGYAAADNGRDPEFEEWRTTLTYRPDDATRSPHEPPPG